VFLKPTSAKSTAGLGNTDKLVMFSIEFTLVVEAGVAKD
jgi:hypothetical protein